MDIKSVKTVIISVFSFAIFAAFVIFVMGLCNLFTPFIDEVLPRTRAPFRAFTSVRIYLMILPGVIATGLLVGLAIVFGGDKTGYKKRFSHEMFSRLKFAIFIIFAIVFILVLSEEVLNPTIERVLTQYKKLPSRVEEYKDFARSLYDNGRIALSYEMAKSAYTLSPTDKEAKILMDKAESRGLSTQGFTTKDFPYTDNKTDIPETNATGIKPMYNTQNEPSASVDSKVIPSGGSVTPLPREYSANNTQYTPRDLLVAARRSYAAREYFDAHYYATMYIRAVPSGDPWRTQMQLMARNSWDAVESTLSNSVNKSEQALFSRKMAGYNALMEGDNIRAYYIFKSLSMDSRKMALDPDVVRYLRLSEEALQRDYFFSDETLNIEHFESASDVYFKLPGLNGSTLLYYIKGVTLVKSATYGTVRYLRGLCIVTLDSDGVYKTGVYYPYAKLLPLDIATLSLSDQELLKHSLVGSPGTQGSSLSDKGFRDASSTNLPYRTLPHIILNSVDRLSNGVVTSAVFFHKPVGVTNDTLDASSNNVKHLVLGMSMEHFLLLEQAAGGVESMSLESLLKLAPVARDYGYSSQVFSQAVLNRVLYPLFLLVCFMLIALIAFQYRLDTPTGVFKFKWVTVFPVICAIFVALYGLALSLFKMINYNLFNRVLVPYSILEGFAVYALIIIVLCVIFLSCHED